jgi:protein-tyrosine phosphatase
MSFATRDWRKRKDLFKPYQFSDEKRRAVEPVSNPMAQADDSVSPKELQIRQEWMKQRIANLTREAQAMLILCWPEGCPKLQETSPEQLQQLVKVIETVEAQHDIPFFDADPTVKKPAKRKSKAFDSEPA